MRVYQNVKSWLLNGYVFSSDIPIKLKNHGNLKSDQVVTWYAYRNATKCHIMAIKYTCFGVREIFWLFKYVLTNLSILVIINFGYSGPLTASGIWEMDAVHCRICRQQWVISTGHCAFLFLFSCSNIGRVSCYRLPVGQPSAVLCCWAAPCSHLLQMQKCQCN